jgi:uncharacterized SAM-binding protein YcdF (DUF218 family)
MARRPLTRRRRNRRFAAAFFFLSLVAASIWVIGLVKFVNLIPRDVADAESATDAVVVLTGGSMRLETGLKLLQDGYGRKLFISGVHRGVEVNELLKVSRRSSEELDCCVTLGYSADNTVGNARETAIWMREEGFHSLRLVTASYHMPRSVEEFRAVSPDLVIFDHPVFPSHVKTDDWWRWPGTTTLIIGEYHKFLIARARRTLDQVGGGLSI